VFNKLMDVMCSVLQFCYLAVTDTGYVGFGGLGTVSYDTPAYTFTGLTGKITLSSDADVQVGFDEPATSESLRIKGNEQPVTIEVSATKLYIAGMGDEGGLRILSQNLGTGKTDDEIRLEDRMNRKI
jgi:hypothetical protein